MVKETVGKGGASARWERTVVAQLDKQYIKTRPLRVIPRLISYTLFEGRPLTTKGRWINPFALQFNRLLAALPFSTVPKAPIFILGTGRSGTTILGKILSLHSDVGFLNEPKLLWHFAYPAEDLNGNYTNALAQYRLDESHAVTDVSKRMRRIYRGYEIITGSQRVVDKYPELIFRRPFVQKIFPDAKFILLIRNGADTCRSIASWSGKFGDYSDSKSIDWWGRGDRKWQLLVNDVVANDVVLAPQVSEIAKFKNQVDRAAVEWIVTMREALRLCVQNDYCYELRYESLVQDPEGEILRLLQFCQLPMDQIVIDYASSVLKPPVRSGDLKLHPSIHEPFWQTMAELGYD